MHGSNGNRRIDEMGCDESWSGVESMALLVSCYLISRRLVIMLSSDLRGQSWVYLLR